MGRGRGEGGGGGREGGSEGAREGGREGDLTAVLMPQLVSSRETRYSHAAAVYSPVGQAVGTIIR